MKHKHHDAIVAWANGAAIQVLRHGNWYASPYPNWDVNSEFRVAPKVSKSKVFYVGFAFDTNGHPRSVMSSPQYMGGKSVLKITFDSETDAIKSAELVE